MKGVCKDFIELAILNMSVFQHASQLQKTLKILSQPYDEQFLEETKNNISSIISNYFTELENKSPFVTFRLTHQKHLDQLKQFDG